MTLSKLAKLTNVSVSTVSKAFSGSSEVSAETRNLIFDAARRCGGFVKVDGIIVIGSLDQVCAAEGIPTVGILSAQNKRDDMDCIYIDFEHAMYEAIAHLIENGHKKIAFIGEQLTRRKQETFLKYMKRHKLPVPEEYIVTAEKRFEAAGSEAMARLLALPVPPAAPFDRSILLFLLLRLCTTRMSKIIPM